MTAPADMEFPQMRQYAREIFLHALSESSVEKAFARHVVLDRGILRICEDLYDVHSYSQTLVLSIGKAAHPMVQSLRSQLGELAGGIVVANTAPTHQEHGFRYFLGGHPVPNHDSIAGAEAALRSLAALPANSLVLFLLSGGGSAAFEKPVDADVSLEDLVSTYRTLVHSGAPIAEINAIRKHLSAVKGGRLAVAAGGAQQVSLLVSDVPDNAPDALASGPTMADSTSVDDCYRIVQKHNLLPEFPASVRELFERHAIDETPKSDDPAFIRSRYWTILSNGSILQAAKLQAEKTGFHVEINSSCDDWDYEETAEYLVQRLKQLRATHKRACLISGGEVTVKVANGGTGGRNQQFALACAQKIADHNITVLSAGTDGIDGNSPAAGAVADGTTLERARGLGLDPTKHGRQFDAYPLFRQLGDSIEMGPTGNNLRDLRILLAWQTENHSQN